MNEMRKLMNLTEAEIVVDNSPEARRGNMVGNFQTDLTDLIDEYYAGAESFGEEAAEEIIAELEDVLNDATFNPQGRMYG